MTPEKVVKTSCAICQMGCGMLVHLRDGEITRLEGDPESPINHGMLCIKGQASLEYLNSPDRLEHPVKRAGARGEGKWQRISWDEALDITADGLRKAGERYGVESVVMVRGSYKGFQEDYLARFTNAFGTPNIASMAPFCFVPRKSASVLTYGFYSVPDYEFPPAATVLWGLDTLATRIGEHRQLTHALDKGAKLIIVDPRKMKITERASSWLRLRPGSDLALALAMINVIINEDLYDRTFIEKWTLGFDRLKAHVQDYSPEKMAPVTWLSAGTIKEAARLYATSKPACIEWGNAIDHSINSFQTSRAISILRAITGNVGAPGGDLKWSSLPLLDRGSPQFSLQNNITPELRQKRVSFKDNLLPSAFYALPQRIIKAILEEDPYPLRAAYIQGCNMLLTYPNAREVYEALKKLDFIAASDMFLSPTAALADVVLPVTTFLEFDSIAAPPYYQIAVVQQKVAERGECRSDYQILRGLAQRLDIGQYFWDTEEQALDFILKPAGITFAEFRKIGVITGSKQYRNYEKEGFSTPSGKVELYSPQLEKWGFDPLPVYREPEESPLDAAVSKEYPLIFTNWKTAPFRHSGGRQIPALRGAHPGPVVNIHKETAARLGIKEGDHVYIETKRGKIKQKVVLSGDLDPRVIMADYGWWFPEKDASSEYGWTESNINVLTDDKPPFNREMGSAIMRGIPCKVYKAAAK